MASTIPSTCYASGGRALLTINGVAVAPRTVSVSPWAFERDAKSNQDNTLYTTVKPVPAEAEFTLSDSCGLDIMALQGCPIDVTINLLDINRIYLFTAAVIIGRPKINTETGEVSGMKIVSQTVTITQN